MGYAFFLPRPPGSRSALPSVGLAMARNGVGSVDVGETSNPPLKVRGLWRATPAAGRQ